MTNNSTLAIEARGHQTVPKPAAATTSEPPQTNRRNRRRGNPRKRANKAKLSGESLPAGRSRSLHELVGLVIEHFGHDLLPKFLTMSGAKKEVEESGHHYCLGCLGRSNSRSAVAKHLRNNRDHIYDKHDVKSLREDYEDMYGRDPEEGVDVVVECDDEREKLRLAAANFVIAQLVVVFRRPAHQ